MTLMKLLAILFTWKQHTHTPVMYWNTIVRIIMIIDDNFTFFSVFVHYWSLDISEKKYDIIV